MDNIETMKADSLEKMISRASRSGNARALAQVLAKDWFPDVAVLASSGEIEFVPTP